MQSRGERSEMSKPDEPTGADAVPITRGQLFKLGGGLALAASAGSLLAACGSSSSGSTGASGSVGNGLGISSIEQLQPFHFSSTTGPKPSLPKRYAFANIETSPVFTDLANGIQAGCKDRGLDFVQANADNNVENNISQIKTFLQRGTGGLYLLPLGNGTQAPVISQALNDGIVVYNQTASPSTCQVIIPQSKIGQTQGNAAVDWIRKNLGGKATVLVFNLKALTPTLGVRYDATVEALKALGSNVTVVEVAVDLANFNDSGGFSLTSSALQAHPDIDVIIGIDTLLLGAEKAVTEAHNTTVKYMSGSDGDADVLNAIRSGDRLIKETFGYTFPLVGYATAQFTADWLEGKSIPQAIEVNPVPLNSAGTIDVYNQKNANPGKYWKDTPAYLSFLGNISYKTRKDYLRNTLSK